MCLTVRRQVQRLLLMLASLKITLAGLLLLGTATVLVYKLDHSAAPWLAAPLLLLACNLGAAIATNAAFRRQRPLLLFHLALLALVLLAAAGRLTYLKAIAEITEGAEFAGLMQVEAGPLHGGRQDRLKFANEGFSISYLPGPMMDRNVNRVSWQDASGRWQSAEIENNRPLVLAGYRIYPTSNKGFALVFGWQPRGGQPMLTAVHLPSYPANATGQALAWRPAGSAGDIWVMLDIAETLIPADRPSHFRLPQKQEIVLRHDDQRSVLQPGESIELAGGRLQYLEMRTWMGYRVFYDWTIPWMLVACALAICSLGWHFWNKFGARPWDN